MLFVSVTRLHIRAIRYLPAFVPHVVRTRRQVRLAPGFQGGSLLIDRVFTFWTMTGWDGEDSMRRYMTADAHCIVMPHLLDWCDEASVVHWTQAETALPSWEEADRRMRASGRPSKVRHPSPHHATLTYRRPSTWSAGPIAPIVASR